MLDLSRCRNLVEFDFGQALEECLGGTLEPVKRPVPMGIVGSIVDWHTWICIHPPLGWCSPSFLLMSVAQYNLQSQGWKDAPPCVNAVAAHIELDEFGAHSGHEDDATRSVPLGWLPLKFTARDVSTDARGCAQRVCDTFFERQTKVMADAFTLYLEWRASCEKNPCAARRAQNRQPRKPSARCLRIWDEASMPGSRHSGRTEDGHGAIT